MQPIDPRRVHLAADYVRYLSLVCIEKAGSGHPGLPLGCAELGVVLFRYFLRCHPENPAWSDRDRFVLSAGHGSMLLYSLLHLSGYPLALEDLNRFRQWNSRTPGHPERNLELGIETTTGPLGQGFANAVGLAIAARWRARRFNRPGFDLFNNRVFTLVGDGCLMEGISYEAASLAGHLGLDNLLALYDNNHISIDGSTSITFTEDVEARFRAQGWAVQRTNGADPAAFAESLAGLLGQTGKPRLLITDTVIGEGLKTKRGSNAIHGAPAGRGEIAYFLRHSTMKPIVAAAAGLKPDLPEAELMAWLDTHLSPESPLLRHPEAEAFMRENRTERDREATAWQAMRRQYSREFPDAAAELQSMTQSPLTDSLADRLENYREDRPDATRNVSGRVLNLCAQQIPSLLGGSADLAGSTKARINESDCISADDPRGRNIAYGVREHAMGAIGNGMALDGGIIPFCGTFFTFMDYMKPALRLAALMRLRHLFLFSHDSIFLGEDGPTHQPVEHLNSLRLIPDLTTFRPANPRETALAFRFFLTGRPRPVAVVTTRQKINPAGWQSDPPVAWEDFQLGAYVFHDAPGPGEPDLILVASGSELGAAAAAAAELESRDGYGVRVISLPSLDLFAAAPERYRNKLLLQYRVPVFLVEAASYRGVDAWFDSRLQVIDLQRFGQSAPGAELGERFGFSPTALGRAVRDRMAQLGAASS